MRIVANVVNQIDGAKGPMIEPTSGFDRILVQGRASVRIPWVDTVNHHVVHVGR